MKTKQDVFPEVKGVPFPKLTLSPINLEKADYLNRLSTKVCRIETKDFVFNYLKNMHVSHDTIYPVDQKEFYLIPFNSQRQVFNEFPNLRWCKFSPLFIPYIASNYSTVLRQLPKELENIIIVGWNHYEFLSDNNSTLSVDISMGFPTMFFWTYEIGDDVDPSMYILVELSNEA